MRSRSAPSKKSSLYFRELVSRKETILASIQEQGKLTDELKARIDQTLDKSELEDLYLPYKPKRRTKAMIAREKGLEPLADYLWNQEPTGTPLETFAASFVDAEKGVASVEEALEGARHIVAETISDNADIRKLLRHAMFEEGVIVSKKTTDAVDEQQKFKMYYDYREPVKQIPSHRMLAIRRGETENVLYFLIELDPQRPLDLIKSKIHKRPGDWTPQLNLAAEDAWKRLLNSSITSEVRLELKQRADTDAIQVFRENLQNLLLAPPAGQLAVLGLDPGIRTGCKIAVVDDTGKFLAHDVIYPFQPKNDVAGAERTLKALIEKYNVRAIAIGNGTASRETDALVRDFLEEGRPDVDLLRDGERVGRIHLFRLRNRAPGVPRSRPHRSRSHLHRAPLAGPAGRTGEARPQVHRRRPVSARRGSEPSAQIARDGDRKLRQPRRRGSEHRFLGAAALRGRHQRTHRAEDRRVPQ